MSSTEDFFAEQRDQSRVKTKIVCSYFSAWSKILKNKPSINRMAYIDLFVALAYTMMEQNQHLSLSQKCALPTRFSRKKWFCFSMM